MAFRVLRGLAPPYLSQMVRVTPTWSSLTPIIVDTTTSCSAFQSVYCRTALVSCCSIRSLELLAIGHCCVIALFTHFSSAAQDIVFFVIFLPTFYGDIFVFTVHALVDSEIVLLFEPRSKSRLTDRVSHASFSSSVKNLRSSCVDDGSRLIAYTEQIRRAGRGE